MSGRTPDFRRPGAIERMFGRALTWLVWIGVIRGHFYILTR
jgi:hypothetical protein